MPDPAPFKDRLHHRIPAWISDGATFHVRVRCQLSQFAREPLTSPSLGRALLDSACFYRQQHRWHCSIFLLMPDHLHMLVTFSSEEGMSRVVHDWKRWHTRQHAVSWQDGYFDHRIRSDREFELKARYVRQNPVVKKLCAQAEDWPWLCEPDRDEE
jgi:putative transposase